MTRLDARHSAIKAMGPDPEGGLFRALQCLIAMLVAARLLIPTESAVLGGTLWITQLWIVAMILWGWDAYRRADDRLRLGAIDAAVWIVILGHLLSTGYVLRGNGESRSALNLMWEWIGLGCSFFLIRQVLRTRQDASRLVVILLSFAVTLGGYGIWQHYVEMPRVARDYERIVRERGEPSAPDQRKAVALQRELASMGVPSEPSSRSLWERRLKSTEPFATFALANTLAGFLAAWVFVLIDGLWLGAKRDSGGFRLSWGDAAKLAGVFVIGYCLVLTKSRTAWAGFAMGFLVWGMLRGASSFTFSRRWLWTALALALIVAAFFIIAWQSGGLDWEVISEAPKSLEYRWQYWAGAWNVVKHQPWLGTGPGNFRQHYLHYKRPESSEEIADPHNWILDLWASGGLLALGGFAIVIALAARAGWRHWRTSDDKSRFAPPSWGISAWDVGAGLSFFLVLLMSWLSAEPFDARMIGLLAGAALVWMVLQRAHVDLRPLAGVMAGGLAILVHLLGAGGIEMPAITQSILVFVVLLFGASWEREPSSIKRRPKWAWAFCGLAVLCSVLCWQTAMKPVWYRVLLVQSGDVAFGQDYNPGAAAKWYEEAHAADAYSPEPLERLADLHFQSWRRTSTAGDFALAVESARKAMPLDPVTYRIPRQLGLMYYERAARTLSADDAERAVEYLREAAARYPSSSELRAELALAFQQAGQTEEAAREAKTALELDEINRNAGHIDKFLPEPVVKSLEEIRSRE